MTSLADLKFKVKKALDDFQVAHPSVGAVKTAANEWSQGVRDFGAGLGQSAAAVWNAQRQANEADRAIAESNKTLQTAKMLQQNGQADRAAQLTRSQGTRLGDLSLRIGKDAAAMPTEREMTQKLVSGGLRTGLTIAGSTAPIKQVATNAVVGGGLEVALGDKKQSAWERFGKGAGASVKYTGINRGTGPLVDRATKTAGLIPRVITKAGENLAEDMAYARLAENRNLSPSEAVLSVALPTVTEVGGEAVKKIGLSRELAGSRVSTDGYVRNRAGQLYNPETHRYVPESSPEALKAKSAQQKYIKLVGGGETTDKQIGKIKLKKSGPNSWVDTRYTDQFKSDIETPEMKVVDAKTGKIKLENGKLKLKSNTPKVSVEPSSDLDPKEIKKVADNLEKYNPGFGRANADAMAKDVILNRPPSVEPVGGKVEEVPQIITDPFKVKKLQAAIAKGEQAIRQGGWGNNKFTDSEMDMARRAVNSAKSRLGLPIDEAKIANDLAMGSEKLPFEDGAPDPKPTQMDKFYFNSKPQPETFDAEEALNKQNMADFAAEDPEGKSLFKNMFREWIGKRDAAKTRGTQVGTQFADVDPKVAKEIIQYREGSNLNVSPEAKKIADDLKLKYDELFQKAHEAGIDMGYLENYVTHIWKQSPQEVAQKYKSLGSKFKFASDRVLPTYDEGIAIGLTPKYTNPGQIIGEYVSKLEKTKANIELFNQLKTNGFIVPASIGHNKPGFEAINAPGFPSNKTRVDDGTTMIGSWYAPREVTKQINKIFSPPEMSGFEKVVNWAGKVSGKVQDLTMSGGIPGTPLNAFSVAQVLKEVTAGRLKSPVTAFVRAMSPGYSKAYFEKNMDQIVKMQERNIPISSNYSIEDMAKVDLTTRTFKERLTEGGKNTWDKLFSDPTFKRFLPQLQINLFNEIETQALGKGKVAGEAADIAANAVKKFYGVINSGDEAMRGQTGKDFLKAVSFAPKYRESMINFWVENIKAASPVHVNAEFNREGIAKVIPSKMGASLNNPLSLENVNNTRFVFGAALTYFAYDSVNYALNGRHMSENPPGKEDKLLIPLGDGTVIGVPYLSSIATVPRGIYREGKYLAKADLAGAGKDFLSTFGSQGVKTVGELMKNEDYFGKEISKETDTPGEKLGKQLGHVATANNHPWIKAGIESKMNPFNKGEGDPLYQTASKAMELPFRFYTTDQLNKNEFYSKLYDEVKPITDRYYALKKTDPVKAEEYFNQNIDKFGKLKEMESLARATKESGDQSFINSYDTGKPKFGSGVPKVKAAEGTVGTTQPIVYRDEDGSVHSIIIDKYIGEPPTDPVKRVRWDNDKYSKAMDIFRAEGVDEQKKQEAYKLLNVDPNELDYYDIASDNDRGVRATFAKNFINSLKPEDDRITQLSTLRKTVRDKNILGDNVIDDLVDEGILSSAEGKKLKNLDWNEKTGTWKKKSGGKISIQSVKFTPTQVATPARMAIPQISMGTGSRIKLMEPGKSSTRKMIKLKKLPTSKIKIKSTYYQGAKK